MINRMPLWIETECAETERALVLPEAHPRYASLCTALARLRTAGHPLPEPQLIEDWRGQAHYGNFVTVDARTCGLHIGRGHYVLLDVQRDLNGIVPQESVRRILCRSGAVREPDTRGTYNFF